MAKAQTMDAIETTIDTVTDTVDTLERIPKVHLNGTTKGQQILILSTVAGVSVALSSVATYKVMKRKLRRKTHLTQVPPVEPVIIEKD